MSERDERCSLPYQSGRVPRISYGHQACLRRGGIFHFARRQWLWHSLQFLRMISALAFVPKGASSANPARQVPSAQELEMLRQMDELGIVDGEGVAVKADEMEDDDRDIAQLTGAEAAVAAAAAADGEDEENDEENGTAGSSDESCAKCVVV